jgi:Ni/Co efflux regulator RcnB
MYVRRLIGPS